nr:PREDICTED: eukaryotic translation initiation factor 2 subunit 2 isoform X1 [Bemisia tabaci]
MAEDDSIFDPSAMKKKKKKKKTGFDIDAALGDGGNEASETTESSQTGGDKENQEPSKFDDFDGDLDLDSKKKKKKKKTLNLDELESALPEAGSGGGGAPGDGEGGDDFDDTFDLDMDFSKAKKKKKKQKANLEELVAEDDSKKTEDKDTDPTCCLESEKSHSPEVVGEDESLSWLGSDRDYTYDELLTRVFDIMRDKNPDMVAGKKQKFIMRPPQVVRIGTKKTSFANFEEICKTLHRLPKHLLDFLLAELGTSGSVDGNHQLIIKGRFQQKQIENVLRRYIKEYVTCHTCRSPETILQKDTRLFFLQCETCGSRCSVASIKSGFQAVTGKRAAIRAKTA